MQILPLWLVLASACLTGCALDWSKPPRGPSLGDDAGTSDAGANDDGAQPAPPEPDASEPDPACLERLGCPEHSRCSEDKLSCVCETGYAESAEGCVPDACSPVHGGPTCGENEQCEVREGAAVCVCSEAATLCDGRCSRLENDAAHCGSCDFACAEGIECAAGRCVQKVHALAVAQNVSCALMEEAEGNYPLRCWGSPTDELFRDGEELSSSSVTMPRAVTGIPSARLIALSPFRRCIVPPNEDNIYCWGHCGKDCGLPDNWTGKTVGYETTNRLHWPGLSALSTAEGHANFGGNTCALSGVGLFCWGKAQMVDADADRSSGRYIEIGEGASRFLSVSGSRTHNCGVLSDGHVGCWGDNSLGQLGSAATGNPTVLSPGRLITLTTGALLGDVVQVSAGWAHSCAVTQTGKLYCWGSNQLSALGQGNDTVYLGAVEVTVPEPVTSVDTFFVTYAIAESGNVYGWGHISMLFKDGGGDLSDGAVFGTPQLIPQLRGAVELQCRDTHCCGRFDDGDVKCWGENQYGQLGDGTEIQRLLPTHVRGLF